MALFYWNYVEAVTEGVSSDVYNSFGGPVCLRLLSCGDRLDGMKIMSLFDEVVVDAQKGRTFVDVGRAGFDSGVIFGIIVQASDEFLGIVKFSESGEYDGLVVIRRCDVTYIGIGGNERTVLEKIVNRRGPLSLEFVLDLSSIRSVIESFSSRFGYISVSEEDYSEDFYIGELLRIDDDHLLMCEYGTKKAMDRPTALLRLDLITKIEADGKYERSILDIFANK